MPKGEKYSARYYIDDILTLIRQRLIPAGKCNLVIRANNSPCHTANVVLDFVSQGKVRFAPHPLYSPVLHKRVEILTAAREIHAPTNKISKCEVNGLRSDWEKGFRMNAKRSNGRKKGFCQHVTNTVGLNGRWIQ
jgi:hypothetical protein